MYPKLEINTNDIINNFYKIKSMCNKNCNITLVTKMLSGNFEVVNKIIKETNISDIADAHIYNMKYYADLPVRKWLIRQPGISEIEDVVKYVDISFNSELVILEKLNSEAKKQNKIHNVLLTYELGDLREGCNKEELYGLIKETKKLENIKVLGISANLSCYGGVIPTKENMAELKKLAEDIEKDLDFKIEILSAPNTSAIPMIKNGEIPEKINSMRIGEAILCGYNTSYDQKIDGCSSDTFLIKAEIVEVKNKPSVPRGTIYVNAEGNKPQFEDLGIRKKALISLGNEDINITELLPKDKKIKVLGGCSNYTVLDVTDCDKDYKVGDIITFNIKYFSILKAMSSKYVEKEILPKGT